MASTTKIYTTGFLCALLLTISFLKWGNIETYYVISSTKTILPVNRAVSHSKASLKEKQMNSFISDWCLVRRLRVDWKLVLRACVDNMTWSTRMNDPGMRTSGNASKVVRWDLKPAGIFSRFFIQSRRASKVNMKHGGDSWLVRIKGTAFISPTVIDHNNGTYEVLFLALESGVYEAQIRLDYTLCDGYRDPPSDWFIKGNAQGKHQEEGTLGRLDDYLLEPLAGKLFHKFTIAPSKNSLEVVNDITAAQMACGSCRFLWDGYGRWVHRLWKPFVPGSLQGPLNRDHSLGKGTLWAYGDSLNFNRYRYNFNKSALCSTMFDRCTYNINFVYHIKYRIELDTTETDDLDFDVHRVLKHFRSVILEPRVNHVNTVIILNMGLHYVMSLSFERYQDLIQRVIGVLKETGPQEVRRFKGHVIWLTTTAINKEKAKHLQSTKWRFCTYQRVMLFNAYATSAMCEAGIDIMDMYPITDSYPDGTYDVVHYRPPASQPIVPILEDYLDFPLTSKLRKEILT